MSVLQIPTLWGLLVASVLIFRNFEHANCLEFHRNTTGVVFSAYVHNKFPQDDAQSEWKTYSLEHVKTMMRIMAKRFSKITTFGMGAGNEPYEWNKTYYQSYSQVFTGEAAALVNKEMRSVPNQEQPPLSVYLGLWMNSYPGLLENEISLAMESATKANVIHRNTVKGIIFGKTDLDTNVTASIEVYSHIRALYGETSKLGLKLGSRQMCRGIGDQQRSGDQNLKKHQIELIQQLDFIICEVEANLQLGASAAAAGVKTKLSKYREDIKAINPRIEVMGQTGFPASADKAYEVEAMVEFWQNMDIWAVQQNFTVWMLEAFDNPWKPGHETAGNYGWWKLMDDAKTGVMEGYLEKVTKYSIREGRVDTASTEKPHKGHDAKPTAKPDSGKKQVQARSGASTRASCAGAGVQYFANFLVTFIAVRVGFNKLD